MRATTFAARSMSVSLSSPSMPRWTWPSRSSSRTTVSPLALKRKWPGSMMPACTGPTGIKKVMHWAMVKASRPVKYPGMPTHLAKHRGTRKIQARLPAKG